MVKRIIARFWNTRFKRTIFRLIPRSISENEDCWDPHAAMATSPNQEGGGDPHLLHSTGSYLFDEDGLMIDLKIESSRLHLGQDSFARCILDLEAEVKGWATAYNKANEATLRANQEIPLNQMGLREELARRPEVEEKLVETQGDLDLAKNHLDLMEEEEEKHLNDIDRLEKKVKELKKKNKDLQN